ncbi:MAG: nucleoside triphosphate pyrophosphohydrolase [Candidatus Marinimicrobia bacterium]|nr:nucleoside triphosphate pyrophosphohydrolase [Candidatus Neomarinimicrobiota bacterium]
MIPEKQVTADTIDKLILELWDTMIQLRAPGGCPWDRDQTARSLIPYLLEETYELIEAIESGNQQEIREELGDLLLHVIFQGLIAEEQEHFTLADSIRSIINKLVQRHPHVFGDHPAEGAYQAKRNWETVKANEKKRDSLIDGVPKKLPALNRARRVQEKAAHGGFDWDSVDAVWDKVHEEMAELAAARNSGDPDEIEDELGDLLFSVVNLGRFLGVSSEEALRRTIAKFEYRFRKIEEELKRRGKTPQESTLEEMDAIWNETKKIDAKI